MNNPNQLDCDTPRRAGLGDQSQSIVGEPIIDHADDRPECDILTIQ